MRRLPRDQSGRNDALDGLRAFAVAVVMAFHFGIPGGDGGFLGVDLFFVLSGFLITRVLLGQVERRRVDLATFWTRRARRLAPALVLADRRGDRLGLDRRSRDRCVTACGATLRRPSGTSPTGTSSRRAATSPQRVTKPPEHMWSLAVEEQFYVALAALALVRLPPARAATEGAPRDGRLPGARRRPLLGLEAARAVAVRRQRPSLHGHGFAHLRPARRRAARGGTRSSAGLRSVEAPVTPRAPPPLGGAGMLWGLARFGSHAGNRPCIRKAERSSLRFPLRGGRLGARDEDVPQRPGSWAGCRLRISAGSCTGCTSGTGRSSSGSVNGQWLDLSGRPAVERVTVLLPLATIGLASLSYHLVEKPIRYGSLSRPTSVRGGPRSRCRRRWRRCCSL